MSRPTLLPPAFLPPLVGVLTIDGRGALIEAAAPDGARYVLACDPPPANDVQFVIGGLRRLTEQEIAGMEDGVVLSRGAPAPITPGLTYRPADWPGTPVRQRFLTVAPARGGDPERWPQLLCALWTTSAGAPVLAFDFHLHAIPPWLLADETPTLFDQARRDTRLAKAPARVAGRFAAAAPAPLLTRLRARLAWRPRLAAFA